MFVEDIMESAMDSRELGQYYVRDKNAVVETDCTTTESESEPEGGAPPPLKVLKSPKTKQALCSKHLLPYTWEPTTLPRRISVEDKPKKTPNKKIKILKPIRLTKAGIASQLNLAKRLEKQLKALDKPGTRRISMSKIGREREKWIQDQPQVGVERGTGLTKKEFFQFKPEARKTHSETPMDCPAEFFWQPYKGFVEQIHGGDFEQLTEQDALSIGAEVFCSEELADAMEPVKDDQEVYLDPNWALSLQNEHDIGDFEVRDNLAFCRPQPRDHNYAFFEGLGPSVSLDRMIEAGVA